MGQDWWREEEGKEKKRKAKRAKGKTTASLLAPLSLWRDICVPRLIVTPSPLRPRIIPGNGVRSPLARRSVWLWVDWSRDAQRPSKRPERDQEPTQSHLPRTSLCAWRNVAQLEKTVCAAAVAPTTACHPFRTTPCASFASSPSPPRLSSMLSFPSSGSSSHLPSTLCWPPLLTAV